VRLLRSEQTLTLPPDWRECLAVAWVSRTSGLLISIARVDATHGELWHLETTTGELRQVALNADFIFDASVSDDGRRLAYSTGAQWIQVQRLRGFASRR
jgi:hypothetical protein